MIRKFQVPLVNGFPGKFQNSGTHEAGSVVSEIELSDA